ncbi:MAG: hypothetical protein JSV20_01775 [Candidatus Bathyarchaeota archaeon]|nr:MAG: hypothetical protein JSV20_01775 [Candidatus Bathyarchaeota archaeon]
MSDYLYKYPEALVKSLLWSRDYHRMLIKDIEKELKEVSKKHEITVELD